MPCVILRHYRDACRACPPTAIDISEEAMTTSIYAVLLISTVLYTPLFCRRILSMALYHSVDRIVLIASEYTTSTFLSRHVNVDEMID